MPVLPKYQLKQLFESGDLITQTTLGDLIDATYNPILVGGTDITLNSVTTPSGTTITINSAGGGGTVASLTTVGSSGAATLTSGVLNIPIYGGGLGSYTNATPTPLPFPGNSPFDTIPANSTFSNQTFTEMMNAMLYPTLDPTLSPPTQTLSIAPGPQVNQYQEIGSSMTVTLNATFNQGSISPAYAGGPSVRSGVPVTYNFGGPQVSVQTTSSLGPISENTGAYTILIGAQTWTNSITYLVGGQPLDSNGDPFSTPLPPGTTSTISKTITGVYPLFATSSNITTLTIQSLRSMTTYAEVSLVTEQFLQPSDRQEVDIPDAWATITGVQTFNSVIGGGTWITTSLSDWTTSPTSHVIQTVTIPYTKYKNNVGFPKGAAQYRFLT